MGIFELLSGKLKPQVQPKSVEHAADGTTTVTHQFTLEGEPRPVNDAAVTALDDALQALGGASAQVMHAMDLTRILSFEHGGPPVWSVAMVPVPGPRPYTLLLTYGFSHAVSPEPFRQTLHHEYTLAVPQGVPLAPWADAFLRYIARYVLTSGADVRPGDCVPLRAAPMTRTPFQPEHHAKLPESTLVGVVCTGDPVLPRVETPHGPIEVRRLVGIDVHELDRAETWSLDGFIDELKRADPLLLSPPVRPSLMDDAAFRARVDARAQAEGNQVNAALFDFEWKRSGAGAVIRLPSGREAKRLSMALEGRRQLGLPMMLHSLRSNSILADPGVDGVQVHPQQLVLGDVALDELMAAVRAGDATFAIG